MRIAVISDVHGNCLALEAVLDDIARHGVDGIVNLGDMVSGPLEPRRAAELLIAAGFPSVAGNHERYLTTDMVRGPVDRFAHAALLPAQLSWLAALPKTLVVAGDVFLCHGTPRDDDTPWLDDWLQDRRVSLPSEAQVAAAAEGIGHKVLLCGHTHVARVVRLRDGRLVVNPGSVGLQTNYGSPDARYAILEERGGSWSVALMAIPYDHRAAAQQAAANGFPHWREALTTGWASAEGLF